VVHFDINETILVGDEAGGDTRDDCLNKVLSKVAFVQVPSNAAVQKGSISSWKETSTTTLEPTHWWNGMPIVDSTATNDTEDDINNKKATRVPPPLYIGWEWPDGCCPYYRTAFKTKAKTFCDHDGAMYRPLLQQMDEILQLQDHDVMTQDDDDDDDHLPPVLHHMIPAFFHTLQELMQRTSTGTTPQKKTIVFRTMGSDLHDIAAACNAFAQGKHPQYPNFCNDNLLLDDTSIVKGRWVQNTSDGTTVYQLFHGDTLVAAGDQEVLDFIHSRTVVGIQDDYPFWNAHGYAPWSGKPVWKLPHIQHIL
jgi:hypothetical protein